MRRIDLTGKKFGRLLVEGPADNRGRRLYWLCACDCGVATEVRGGHLTTGATTSCGCALSDAALKRVELYGVPDNTRHGQGRVRAHARTTEYVIWSNMIQRTTNPNNPAWPDYGGRGITVCDRWRDFANFYSDMGTRPTGLTLDRIDNNGNYEPGNCRWATWSQQRANQRPRKKAMA